jgi:RNA polymerase sigma factor (sigma-70 family)
MSGGGAGSTANSRVTFSRVERRRGPDITLWSLRADPALAKMIRSALVPPWPPWAPSAEPAEAGEQAARIERIVHHHLDAVWHTARNLGVLPRDLEDIVQEVLMVCVRRLRDIDPERERAFLLAATARIAANWRRGRRRRPSEPLENIDSLGASASSPVVTPTGPAEALEHKRELELVQAALDQMTETQREAFTLFDIEGLTAREIASELGLSEVVVFARVQRARAVFHRFVSRAKALGRDVGPG